MSRRARSFLGVVTTVVSMAVGVVVARQMQQESASISDTPLPQLVAGDLDAARSPAPLLGPVQAGGGSPDYDALNAAAVIDGELVSSPIIGGVLALGDENGENPEDSDGTAPGPSATTAATDDTTGDTTGDDTPASSSNDDQPIVFDPAIGLRPARDHVYDLCAGPAAGSDQPVGCPDGYAGTLLASRVPPEPRLEAIDGPRLACPGFPQSAVTVYSATPLVDLTVAWRVYAGSDAWSAVTAEGTPADLRTAWEARFEAEEYSLAEFGYLAHCGITIDRDPDLAYELRLTAHDSFGRLVKGTAVLPDATPEGRPPTMVLIDDAGHAQVTSWTTEAGSVAFAAVEVRSPSEAVCPTDSFERDRVADAEVQSLHPRHPTPAGVFDPAFTRQVLTDVPLTPGATMLLCARVFDTANPLRPLATDEFLLQGPAVQVPRVVLHDIHFTEPLELDDGEVEVEVSGAGVNCGSAWRNDDPVVEGHLSIRPPVEFTCSGLTLPLDGTGSGTLQIATRHRHEGRWLSSSYSIAIPQRDCSRVSCGSSLYWEEYAVPMPPTTQVICDRPFWDTSACNPPGDGVALVNVLYDIVGSGSTGSVQVLRRTDRSDPDPAGLPPTMQLLTGGVEPSFSWTAIPARLAIVSDRAVVLEEVRLSALEVASGTDPSCVDTRTLTVGGAPATEFSATLSICAGLLYAVEVAVTDIDGTRHHLHVGTTSVVATSNDLAARVEFLGGDVPAYGWVYQFSAVVEGSSPYRIAWSATSLPGKERCRALDTTVAELLMPEATMLGSTIDVRVRLNITTAGDSDCPLSGRVAPGVIEVAGSFTLDQLFSGAPLVLVTPPDAELQMRVTLGGTWRLGPLGVQA